MPRKKKVTEPKTIVCRRCDGRGTIVSLCWNKWEVCEVCKGYGKEILQESEHVQKINQKSSSIE